MSMTDTELFNEAYSAEDDAKAMPSDLLSHFVKQYLELESYKSVSLISRRLVQRVLMSFQEWEGN
jgi:hypothetical protein